MDLENLMSRAKWQEEEEDPDDVKDNWEDEDEEPPKAAPAAESKKGPAGGSPKNKKGLNNKGGEQSDAASGSNSKPMTAQELRDKKLLEERLQRESELKLAKQMLGLEDKNLPLEFPLESKEDFDKFHKNLVQKLWCYDKSPHYYLLLDKLFRDLCVPLEADELKNLSSTVNALFNEKVKTQKAKPKKKGAKVAIKMERNNLDRSDMYDDLDDIM